MWSKYIILNFKKLLIIHKENTKEISTMTVILYVIKVCSKLFLAYCGLDNVDLQNNYAIEIMKWVVFEAV